MSIAKAVPPRFTLSEAKQIAQDIFGIVPASTKDLGSYIDQNILVTAENGQQYLLKIHDQAEKRAVLELQTEAMHYLQGKVCGVSFPQVYRSLEGDECPSVTDTKGETYYVRLLHFLPGTLIKDIDIFSAALLSDIGRTVGGMDHALFDFDHPAANRADLPWDLKNASQTGQLSRYIADPHQRRLAEFFLMKFDNEVAPILAGLRKSVTHNDSHRYSILVDAVESSQERVSGVIDFGDIVYTHTVCNLSICLSDIIVHCEDPISGAAVVVKAYHQQHPLTEDEVSVLFYLIATRISLYVCMAAYSREQDPENNHAQLKEKQMWALLEQMLAVNPIRALDAFRDACGMPSLAPERQAKAESNLAMRNYHFSGSLYTHYQEPLHLTGGALQYLFDDQGNTYYDCVNNVCQWGHCHPTIVRAAQKQMARLNTNSRYVYDQMTDYAERLLATFPDPLNVVFFVNSGSEANDLAMRIARTVNGQQDMIVLDKAYHGNSQACTDISPHRIDRPGKPGLPSHVHKAMVPDTFRGPYKVSDPEAGSKYALDVARIIKELEAEGKAPTAFIAESLVGTGGQYVLPPGYLTAVYEQVRAKGGLCIADEVQVGFGRTGEHTWCFESQGVVPDIVTMGKPIGNGHPMAAVVTTREIADAFDNGVAFFNTFGGNPVSCAIGQAVLDVLEDEQLEAHVVKLNAQMMAGLNELKDRYPFIVDVRGQGLYIGVELVNDPETLEPATAMAKTVVERMKAEQQILLNTNGYDNHIIKIKPAMIIGEKDVDRLVTALDKVFATL
ncbi:MAG: aminotransferase class III-fold pyridoxal phosphate-dependent enzyme [Amphritea sp.]